MARLYPDASGGALLRALFSDDELRQFPTPPEGAGAPFAFDAETNAALVADIRHHLSAYAVTNGTLTKNGQPVTIAAPSRHYQDRQATDALLAKLDADTPLSAAELRQALRFTLRLLKAQVG